jgi:hypothetical protein
MPRKSTRRRPPLSLPTKKIHKNSLLGQKGVNLIEKLVLDMGCLWYPTGAIEAGIDGQIELRDPTSGEVGNLIIQVQSKAKQDAFTTETPTSFEYLCEERDLVYWLNGNAPVILVVSRPDTNEAYWADIKDYFKDLSRLKARKVYFDKRRDRFDATCREALLRIAAHKDSGVYLSPPPQIETLYSNLLKVDSFAEHIYIASTDYRKTGDVWRTLPRPAPGERWSGEWFLKNEQIISFLDLDAYPWNTVCDVGTVECFDAAEWAYSKDEDRQRDFVRLLNGALKERLWPGVRYSKQKDCYYFIASPSLGERKIEFDNVKGKSIQTVFKGYATKKQPNRISFYRHSAFRGFFVRHDNEWYLEINPTHYFTSNGRDLDVFFESHLSGLKRIERNEAVLRQVLMWASYLQRSGDLFTTPYPYVQFGSIQTGTIEAGIDDQMWLTHEEEDEAKLMRSDIEQLDMFEP